MTSDKSAEMQVYLSLLARRNDGWSPNATPRRRPRQPLDSLGIIRVEHKLRQRMPLPLVDESSIGQGLCFFEILIEDLSDFRRLEEEQGVSWPVSTHILVISVDKTSYSSWLDNGGVV